MMLVKNKSASVLDLASALGLHHKTIYNYISSYEANGLEGLRLTAHYPVKVNNELVEIIQAEQHKNPHMTLTTLSRKLSNVYELTVSEKTIRKLIESETISPLAKELAEPDGQISLEDFLKEQPIKYAGSVAQEPARAIIHAMPDILSLPR